MIDRSIIELLEATNPVTTTPSHNVEQAWSTFQSTTWTSKQPWRRPVTYAGLGTLAAAASVIVATVLPVTQTTNAVAAQLRTAAKTNTELGILPAISAGQFYYQSSLDNLVCTFTLPGSNAAVNYVIGATVQSWTDESGQGKSTLTYLPEGQGGTGWKSQADQQAYLNAGSPTNPCTTSSPNSSHYGAVVQDNQLLSVGQPAGTTTTSDLVGSHNLDNLPSNASQVAAILANGQWNPITLSVNPAPGACAIAGPGTNGCDTSQQLSLLGTMMTLPDASARLSTVLYQVLSQMPGVSSEPYTTSLGMTGTRYFAPSSPLSIVVDQSSGILLATETSSASPLSVNGDVVPLITNIGPIVVVDGPDSTTPSAIRGVSPTEALMPMPAANASHDTWVAWAARQREAMRILNLMSTLTPTPGCKINSAVLTPVVNTGAGGIPKGLITSAITVTGSCAH